MKNTRVTYSRQRDETSFVSRARSIASLPWIEAVVSIVVGLILLAIDKQDLAELTWIIGVALSFTRYAFEKRLEEELQPVHKLAQVVDLQRDLSITQLQVLIKAYLDITEVEFKQVKDSFVAEAIENLQKLMQQKTSNVLATGDYYNWLLPFIEAAPRGSKIWAVSMMMDVEWDDSPPEQNFIRLNLEAAKRGVFVERVFVVKKNDIPQLLSIPPIKAQYDNASEFLRPLVVEREYLEAHDPQLLKQLGDGLMAFDTRVALIDISSPEGIRGYVTMNQGEINRFRRLFDNLKIHARHMKDVVH